LRGDFAPAVNNELEPNDTIEDAQLLVSGQTVRGFLSHQDDADVFQYDLEEAGRLTLSIARGTLADTWLNEVQWLDADGTRIGGSGSTGFRFPYNHSMDLEAGNYYIVFREREGFNNTGTYTLRGDFVSAGDLHPPNQSNVRALNRTRANAQILTPGQTVRGLISHQNNVDMYRYNLTQQGRVTVNIARGTLADTWQNEVQWLDVDGTRIGGSTSFRFPYNHSMDLPPGTYFIVVTSRQGQSNTGTYNLTIQDSNHSANALVSGVSISPSAVSMQRGFARQFDSLVSGTDNLNQNVTWTIDEDNAAEGTTISNAGLLTIAANETLTTLTVRATSVADNSRSGIAVVTVVPSVYHINVINGVGGGSANHNTSVTVQATPVAGHTFDGWYEGNTRVSTSVSFTFNATSDRTLFAWFNINRHTINVTAGTGGVASGGGAFNSGSSIMVTAIADPGFAFLGWFEGEVRVPNAGSSYTFDVTANRNLQARFMPFRPTIIIPSDNVVGGGSYNYGDDVTLTATPPPGYVFEGWFENGVSISTSVVYTFTATEDREIEARFVPERCNNCWNTVNDCQCVSDCPRGCGTRGCTNVNCMLPVCWNCGFQNCFDSCFFICDCDNCTECGFNGGRFGFGRVRGEGERPGVTDALQILRSIVRLSSVFDVANSNRADSLAAANITRPGHSGMPNVQDALQILRFLVRLPTHNNWCARYR
jgi:uncharacterized repeat protein (TIGR02543 family)